MKPHPPASRYKTRKTTQVTDWQIAAKVQQALKDDLDCHVGL